MVMDYIESDLVSILLLEAKLYTCHLIFPPENRAKYPPLNEQVHNTWTKVFRKGSQIVFQASIFRSYCWWFVRNPGSTHQLRLGSLSQYLRQVLPPFQVVSFIDWGLGGFGVWPGDLGVNWMMSSSDQMNGRWVEVKIWRCTYTVLNFWFLIDCFWLNSCNLLMCLTIYYGVEWDIGSGYLPIPVPDLQLAVQRPQISKACAHKVLEDLMSLTWGRRKNLGNGGFTHPTNCSIFWRTRKPRVSKLEVNLQGLADGYVGISMTLWERGNPRDRQRIYKNHPSGNCKTTLISLSVAFSNEKVKYQKITTSWLRMLRSLRGRLLSLFTPCFREKQISKMDISRMHRKKLVSPNGLMFHDFPMDFLTLHPTVEVRTNCRFSPRRVIHFHDWRIRMHSIPTGFFANKRKMPPSKLTNYQHIPWKADGWKMKLCFKMIPLHGTCYFSVGNNKETPPPPVWTPPAISSLFVHFQAWACIRVPVGKERRS